MGNLAKERPGILYVDDIDNNLILFEVIFKEFYDVSIANSGKKALELLSQKSFAVLISDQSMPEMSGTELLEITKEKYPDTMRFILTAYTDYKTVVDSINKGEIYGFFNKPFNTEAVKMAIDKAVEVYNLRISNKRMIEELARVNSELLNLDKSKTRYLNVITNEIRSPINKIMSAVHMLKDRIGSNDLSELLFYLDTSVSRLESFSYTANQLARLNEGSDVIIDAKILSVRELVELCVLENKNMLDRFHTNVILADKAHDIFIKGESDLLITCLTTLLMGSLKQTDKDSTIRIKCGESPEGSHVEIISPGEFYSRNEVDNMVNFYSDTLNSTDFTPGIELILAKQIMIAHSGKIVINMNEDKTVSTRIVFPNVKEV